MPLLKHENKSLKSAFGAFVFCSDSSPGDASCQRGASGLHCSVEFPDIKNVVKGAGTCHLRGRLELKCANGACPEVVECVFSCKVWKGGNGAQLVTLGKIRLRAQHTQALVKNVKSEMGVVSANYVGL